MMGIVAAQSLLYSQTPSPPSGLAAVRFDNTSASSGLAVTAQVITDSPLLTVSMWFRTADTSYWPVLVGLSTLGINASYISLGFFAQGDIGAVFRGSGVQDYEFSTNPVIANDQSVHHLMMSIDTNHATNTKLENIVLDGSAVPPSAYLYDPSAAFDISMNGGDFGLPTYEVSLGTGFIVDMAEVWIGVGQYVTDVTKFRTIGGSAVDLGANGETPTGTSPTYYFTGGASTFATNAGTGPAVTLIGTITDVSFL